METNLKKLIVNKDLTMSSEFRNFLESSSIHGALHIAKSRQGPRLFWMLIVVSGLAGAALLIQESFHSWSESPIRTTIETMPISKLRFPRVSVCPPRNMGQYTSKRR